jgi:phosphate/sulfate permease
VFNLANKLLYDTKMLNLSARGFCVEWMAAVTVLVCGISKEFAIPVSTTHCQVGSLFSFWV